MEKEMKIERVEKEEIELIDRGEGENLDEFYCCWGSYFALFG